jgi:hypothetical protein
VVRDRYGLNRLSVGAFRRSMISIVLTQKVLTQCLRCFQRNGMIVRKVVPLSPSLALSSTNPVYDGCDSACAPFDERERSALCQRQAAHRTRSHFDDGLGIPEGPARIDQMPH